MLPHWTLLLAPLTHCLGISHGILDISFSAGLLLFLHILLKWLVYPHLVQSFPMADMCESHALHCSMWIFVGVLLLYLFELLMSSPPWFAFFTISNSLLSLVVLSISFYAPCMSMSWHNSTPVHLFCWSFSSWLFLLWFQLSFHRHWSHWWIALSATCLFLYSLICLNSQMTHPFLSTIIFFSSQLAVLIKHT